MDFSQLGGARVVDLSVTLSQDLPAAWPGHSHFTHHNWNWFAAVETPNGRLRSAAPYHTNEITIDEHCGTHFDAPTHFIPPPDSGLPCASELGDESGEKVPLEDLMGQAVVIDVSYLSSEDGEPGVSPFIEPEHVQRFEEEHGELQPGEVVLLKTDWDRYYVEGDEGLKYTHGSLVTGTFPGWPAPSPELAVYLDEKGIKTLGIDAPSIGSSHDGVPVHQEGLGRGLRYIELLTNLGELPVRGSFFVFLPLKVKGSSGGPGRAMAFVGG